jgi:hypothetical protein
MVWITEASPGFTGRVEASTNMDGLAVAGELLFRQPSATENAVRREYL